MPSKTVTYILCAATFTVAGVGMFLAGWYGSTSKEDNRRLNLMDDYLRDNLEEYGIDNDMAKVGFFFTFRVVSPGRLHYARVCTLSGIAWPFLSMCVSAHRAPCLRIQEPDYVSRSRSDYLSAA